MDVHSLPFWSLTSACRPLAICSRAPPSPLPSTAATLPLSALLALPVAASCCRSAWVSLRPVTMWSNRSCLISLALGASDSHSWPESRAAVKAAEDGANTAGKDVGRMGGLGALAGSHVAAKGGAMRRGRTA